VLARWASRLRNGRGKSVDQCQSPSPSSASYGVRHRPVTNPAIDLRHLALIRQTRFVSAYLYRPVPPSLPRDPSSSPRQTPATQRSCPFCAGFSPLPRSLSKPWPPQRNKPRRSLTTTPSVSCIAYPSPPAPSLVFRC
jgi:hypothetical protein